MDTHMCLAELVAQDVLIKLSYNKYLDTFQMEDPVEEWRDWVYNYEVSNLARVRNKTTGHILKPFKHYKDTTRKHIYYWMHKTPTIKQKLHQIVGYAFLPPQPVSEPGQGPYCIDHINGNRDDNRAVNLQWLTLIENSKKGNTPQ